jgi:sugar (pentulose or hexulose) kinase
MIRPGLSTIALDIGSTSIKGAVLDLEAGELVSVCSRAFPEPIENLPSGHIEIDPKAIVARVLEVIDELAEHLSHHCSVWICGQMGGVILADDRGRAKSNYLSWRDQRTLKSTPGVRSSMETIRMDWPESVFASLGRELHAGSTSALLHWLSEHRKLSDGVLPLSIADYCISHLAKQPGMMHATHAIGLVDLSKWDWHYRAMERIGLGDLWWPEFICDTRAVAEWKIGSRVFEVHGSYGDQQCALFGAGLELGQLSINVSTGSQVSVLADHFQSGPYQTRAYFGDRWLNTVTHLPAGRSLNALMGLFTELFTGLFTGLSDDDCKQLDRAWQIASDKMDRIDSTDLLADIAFFAGPFGSSGSLANMTTENLSVGHVLLAACNAMAKSYSQAAQRFGDASQWTSVLISGGLPNRFPRLVRLIEERFELPVVQRSGEETLLGLLRLAEQHRSAGSL